MLYYSTFWRPIFISKQVTRLTLRFSVGFEFLPVLVFFIVYEILGKLEFLRFLVANFIGLVENSPIYLELSVIFLCIYTVC